MQAAGQIKKSSSLSPQPEAPVSWNQTRRVAFYDRAQLALVDKEWGGAGKKRLQILEEISAVVAASLCTVVCIYSLPSKLLPPSPRESYYQTAMVLFASLVS